MRRKCRSGRESDVPQPARSTGRSDSVDNELRALEAFLEIDLGAHEVLVAHRLDEQCHAVLHHGGVVVVDRLGEREPVLD